MDARDPHTLLNELKSAQVQARAQNPQAKAVLAREEADMPRTLELLEASLTNLTQAECLALLKNYYQTWYHRDSTADTVIASIILTLIETNPRDKTGERFRNFFIKNPLELKTNFSPALLEKLKQKLVEFPDLVEKLDKVIQTPFRELLSNYQMSIIHDSPFRPGISDLTEETKDDMFAITLFQIDDVRFLAQLDVIEARIEAEAKTKNMLDETKTSLKNYVEGKPFKQNKLMFTTLYELAKETGYPGYSKIYGFLKSQEFLDLLAQGLPFKDAGLRGTDHSEEGHLIQLICLGLEYQKLGDKFLSQHPAAIFAALNQHTALELFWGENFEISNKITSGNTVIIPESFIGRSVGRLREFLTHPASSSRYPLLHQLVASRQLKPALSEEKQAEKRHTVTLFKQTESPKSESAPTQTPAPSNKPTKS